MTRQTEEFRFEQEICRRVRCQRRRRHMTQRDLARGAGIRRTYVSRIENGLTVPGLDLIGRLAGALSVRIAELLPCA